MQKRNRNVLLLFLLLIPLFGFLPVGQSIGESWLDGWDYRQGITITNATGAGTNYQVYLEVTYDANMETDFDDIRFSSSDGDTELDYWRESYTASTEAVFWVEVSANLSVSTQVIYMYYGNSTVSTTSDGDDTFLLFDDFSTLDASKWSWSGASVSGGELQLTASEWIKSDDTFNASTAFEVRSKQALNSRHNMGFGAAVPFVGVQWIQHNWDGDAFMYEDNSDTGTLLYPDGTYCIQSLYWKDADEGAYDIDRASQQTRTDTDIPDSDMNVGIQLWGSSSATYYADWCFLRNWVSPEPIASFGLWEQVNEDAVINLWLSIDETLLWGLDMMLILAGLIMIPASALFLVKGGRDGFSSDKVFYFLIAFIFGIALFVGGIMP